MKLSYNITSKFVFPKLSSWVIEFATALFLLGKIIGFTFSPNGVICVLTKKRFNNSSGIKISKYLLLCFTFSPKIKKKLCSSYRN
ncbi:BnaAnng24950D [Brassica napus]|uniref:(rape) hypothetical protein n=1 Tax=Brassica napus TaxID=3708 RepID=A0A078JPN0_BRANA|nr:unnamed protein product [Brassica napus]CDY67671.1 BnaAnng24950D [Brassica napus]